MEANDRTGRSPKSTSTDSNTDTSTTRRRLLGGAAALATIPATGAAEPVDEEDDDVDTDTGDGTGRHHAGKHGGLWASIDLGEVIDEDVEVGVTGLAFDDEPGTVAVSIATAPASLSLDVPPDRARAIADDLAEAADAAEGIE